MFSDSKVSLRSPKIVLGVIGLSAVLAGSLYYGSTTTASVLILNGQDIGYVATSDEGEQLIEHILASRGESLGSVAKTHDKIEFRDLRISKGTLQESYVTEGKLDNLIHTYFKGYQFSIEDNPIAVLSSEEEFNTILQSYQEIYTKPSANNQISSVEFRESIASQPIEVQPEEFSSPENVLELLTKGHETRKEYIAQANDSWWLIARKNNMLTKEVLDGNPGTDEDTTIKVGDKINLVKVTPYLTVISKGIYTGEETIPFDVISKTDYSLPSGSSLVRQEGSDGSKIVTFSYIQENGKNIEKEILEEKITQEPKTQIIAKGPTYVSSSKVALSRGSGKVSGLSWPLQGGLNSYYGYRWGSFHTGLDIDGNTGDPFVAAISGTVSAAGWSGGYGNMILIDHGNGVATRYAHASELYVSKGQKVSNGETIGLVGSTGRSTGAHLHFEVITNGDTTNPLSYLP
ncbi:metalloendopeptidase-like membrane protein [Desulfitobacterium dichloroeliminans LMG P-21439]|uniref:Metalloendopeptidase-like membrane protein n=1 Tax=Desulfitobacterium dichloroeliminans (strain LMG P-21439 / DCA1) TaxID=871963 RepID=L0F800_DESDL|nr:M23 family metallopeptidase [Desulfitobacterium dichloroeliminans]AGA69327.1 metalloendopeptidase-like membrane protein [Desulfitobacterium dichloroeliminans LMG P-21439]